MSSCYLQRQHFHAWHRRFSNPSSIFTIPYRATDTTLDVASFLYGDDVHGYSGGATLNTLYHV